MFDLLKDELQQYIESILDSSAFELVEIIIRRKGKVIQVEVLMDKFKGGINLDECAHFNKQISSFIEEKNLIADDYVVEVSSPGLDRPLKTKRDFERVLGKSVRFHLKEMLEGKKEHMGLVKQVKSEEVEVETKKSTVVVPLSLIQKAVLIID